jgi:hypothetical protein
MKKLTFFACVITFLILSGCENQVYDKEEYLIKFDFLDKINFKLDTSKITITSKVITYEGSFVKILAETIQNDSLDAIKKVSLYQSGSKKITISNIQIGEPINKGTMNKHTMAVSGSLQFNKSSLFNTNISVKSFFLDGTGKITIDENEKK